MDIYNFRLKGYVSFGEYAIPVKPAKKVTDQDLKHILDDWVKKEEHVKSVYDVADGELVLNEKIIRSNEEITPFGRCGDDFTKIKDDIGMQELKEKYPEKYRKKEADLEKIAKTKKDVIDFFANEDKGENSFRSFCKVFWISILIMVFLFSTRMFKVWRHIESFEGPNEVKEFVLKQDFSYYRPLFSYVLNGEPVEIRIIGDVSCRSGNENHRVYSYGVIKTNEISKGMIFTFAVDQNSAGKVSSRISCATK